VLEHNGHTFCDGAAILVYLCETFKLGNVYPLGADQAVARAQVNHWLHWHHRNSREFTISLFAPTFRKDLKLPMGGTEPQKATMANVCRCLNAHLANRAFLVGETFTLADLVVYADMGQVCMCRKLDWLDVCVCVRVCV
jgi:glutathione S-transferase